MQEARGKIKKQKARGLSQKQASHGRKQASKKLDSNETKQAAIGKTRKRNQNMEASKLARN